jgi:hypothetical protein
MFRAPALSVRRLVYQFPARSESPARERPCGRGEEMAAWRDNMCRRPTPRYYPTELLGNYWATIE